ncbi:hypothetical protein RDWZM_008843 [Blomia tropicalis]|uniref:Uncharacterized protein n=1 Tax=Blomia tropicalis TaxID=40697 RepID=A0A9Q0RKH2_BLOTA|nr:hypothetical protein RDWZM_008843 [Blomia tropicalis]
MIIEDAIQKSAIKLNSDNMGLIWNDTLSEFHQFWEMTINYTNHALVQTAAMIQQHRSLQLTIFFIIFIILFISIYSIFFCIYLCKRHCLIKSKYTKKSIKKHLAQSKRNIKRQKHRLFSDDDGCGPQSERRYLLLPTDEQIDIEENQLFGNNV